MNEGNKLIMVEHEVLPDIVRLAQSKDTWTARYATGTLANLAENFETHDLICDVNGLQFLGKLAGGAVLDNDVELQREATRCLANIAASYAIHSQLLADEVHVAMVGACKAEDAQVRRFASICLGNLAIHAPNHSDLIRNSAVPALIDLISLAVGDDVECQRYACLALGNLAAAVENHNIILASDALPPLVKAVNVEDL